VLGSIPGLAGDKSGDSCVGSIESGRFTARGDEENLVCLTRLILPSDSPQQALLDKEEERVRVREGVVWVP
jgi:hypothetical protein